MQADMTGPQGFQCRPGPEHGPPEGHIRKRGEHLVLRLLCSTSDENTAHLQLDHTNVFCDDAWGASILRRAEVKPASTVWSFGSTSCVRAVNLLLFFLFSVSGLRVAIIGD
jgi:hypothetical protein